MERILEFIIKASVVLTVFLVPLAFSPWTAEGLEFPKQYLFFSLVFLGLLAWFAKMALVERRIHLRKNPLNLFVLLFVLAAVLSGIFSADLFSSLFGSFGRFGDGLFGVLSGAALYFLVLNTPGKPGFLLRPFFLSCAFVLAIAYLALLGFLEQPGFNTVAENQETFSLFLAFLASFLAFLLVQKKTELLARPALFALLFSSLGLLFSLGSFEHFALLLFGLLLALLFGLVHFAESREGMGEKGLWLVAVLAFFSFVSLFSPGLIPGLGQERQEPALSQAVSWSIAFETVKENSKNLLLGSGPGTFAIDFAKHRPAELNQANWEQASSARPASHATEVLATMGILGFATYLALAALFFLLSLALLKGKKSFSFALAAAVLFVGSMVHEQTVTLQLAFWLLVALGAASWNLPVKEVCFSTRRFPWMHVGNAALALFALVLAVAFFGAARLVKADMAYLAFAQEAEANLEERMEKAQEASLLNPWQAEYKMALSRLYLQRALGELQKPEQERKQEQVSKDVQLAIAYARGDNIGELRIVGATQLSPNKVASWQTLGRVYQAIKGAPGAAEWSVRAFEKVVELEPANPQLHTQLGKLYAEQEEFAKAREQFKRAIALQADLVEAKRNLALLSEQEGYGQEAISQLISLALHYPRDEETLFQLGRLYYNNGETSKAILQFTKVLAMSPNHSNAHFSLGIAYEKAGDAEKAVQEFEKVLQANPGNQAVKRKLEILRQETR